MTELDESLVRITRGAAIAFGGSLVGLFFAFIGRVLIARIGTEAEYGVFSLALVILNFCAVIATLGLQYGTSRSIAYSRGKKETEKVHGFISASIWFGLLASIILSLILFISSGTVAVKVFHESALGFPLKIFAAAVPFFTFIHIFVSIFRGFDQIKPKVYFQDILRNVLFPLLVLGVILLHLPFTSIFYAYLASLAISCLTFMVYTIKRLPSPIKLTIKVGINPVAKELLLFSLPLLGVAMLQMIIMWTDTLMLGFFKASELVGLYNAAHPLALLILSPLGALMLLHMPVTARLHAQKLMPEIRRNFSILTKWLCSSTLPLFLVLFLFPEMMLSFFFGANYASAANALRILSLGFIINNFLGPNDANLIAMGETRFMMWVTLAAAALNIGLNAALIPPLGIEGAAIASIVVIISIGLIRCWRLYSLSGAQPLSKNLIKPTLVSLVLIFLFQFIFGNFITVVWWMLPLLFIFYYGIYGLVTLLTKSFDHEDIAMLLAMEKRAGIDAAIIKRILHRFL